MRLWKHVYLVYLITILLSISTTLDAADLISLADREKKLVDQGDIVLRNIDTDGKDRKQFTCAVPFIH